MLPEIRQIIVAHLAEQSVQNQNFGMIGMDLNDFLQDIALDYEIIVEENQDLPAAALDTGIARPAHAPHVFPAR